MRNVSALLVLCVTAAIAASASAVTNNQPVVGVLAVPAAQCTTRRRLSMSAGTGVRDGTMASDSATGSCFSTVYSKWLEMAGAKVVPIPYDLPTDQLKTLHSYLNGVLFTGGGLSLAFDTQYYQTAQMLYDLTLAANDAGDYMPLWGTCMGFQLLNILTSHNQSVLSTDAFDSYGVPLPLDLADGATSSRFISAAPSDVLEWLTSDNITVNLHHDGVKPETFKSNAKLSSFYQMISTNKGLKGNEFVSTIEGKNYPVYGTQWHPERPQFEWTPSLNINHDFHAMRSMQFVGNFLVSEARKNSRSFPSPEVEGEFLIYNYAPTTGPSSYQSYVFPASTP